MFPAASVAVARNVVVLPSTTVAVRPEAANAAAVPVAAGVPVQPAFEYSFTVEPASAVPFTAGVVLVFVGAGVTPVSTTGVGDVESWT